MEVLGVLLGIILVLAFVGYIVAQFSEAFSRASYELRGPVDVLQPGRSLMVKFAQLGDMSHMLEDDIVAIAGMPQGRSAHGDSYLL